MLTVIDTKRFSQNSLHQGKNAGSLNVYCSQASVYFP